MVKTKFDSYCNLDNGMSEGCKMCVQGKKLVLFISGLCSRKCPYCSLSRKRKDIDIVYANERQCKNVADVISEIEDNNACGMGITGGDPLMFLKRLVPILKEVRRRYKIFHIHIYLPTKLVTSEKLKLLSEYVDEVRFHPSFLDGGNMDEDLIKIRLAKEFFDKKNIGCEMPMIPDRKEEILDFIFNIRGDVSFVNLNEFEISDANMDYMLKKYKLNEDTYTIAGSIDAGKWILKKLQSNRTSVKVHLCTAKTKNIHQFCERIKRHNILPFGKKTDDGTVIYLVVKGFNSSLAKIGKIYLDKQKNRTILSENVARKILGNKKYKIFRVEEYPTFDREEMEVEEIGR